MFVEMDDLRHLVGSQPMATLGDALPLKVCGRCPDIDPELRGHLIKRAACLIGRHQGAHFLTGQANLILLWTRS